MTQIHDTAQLRTHYRDPGEGVRKKQIDHIDAGGAEFLAATTLAVVATFGPDGADNSPRGGPPGFIRVLDRRRLAFGDLSGNNRLDTYTNLVTHPSVGILCIVPGMEETMRVNGTAVVSDDLGVREATAIDGRVPKVAVVVTVDECYIHCAKALRRSGVWDTSTWPAVEERPSPASILVGHIGIDVDPTLVEADLEKAYEATLWETGGS